MLYASAYIRSYAVITYMQTGREGDKSVNKKEEERK